MNIAFNELMIYSLIIFLMGVGFGFGWGYIWRLKEKKNGTKNKR